jgi:hypothetical protein
MDNSSTGIPRSLQMIVEVKERTREKKDLYFL